MFFCAYCLLCINTFGQAVGLRNILGSPSFRVICRGAIHCVPIPGRCIGDGRNELRPYTISSRFTLKDTGGEVKNDAHSELEFVGFQA